MEITFAKFRDNKTIKFKQYFFKVLRDVLRKLFLFFQYYHDFDINKPTLYLILIQQKHLNNEMCHLKFKLLFVYTV